jgi:hypothetical protein
MNKSWQISRRSILKGLGTLISLPILEAMLPSSDRLAASEAVGHLPRRMAFVYIPNGANMEDWTPKTVGANYELPYILQPLEPFKKDLQVISGLAHDKAFPNGDGPGDHARASAVFLTGCQARKTKGADIRVGVSVDQIAAEKLGKYTRLPSLELSCDKGRMAGDCDSGYSCAYQFNLSWTTDSTPMAPEVDPRLVFDRLFASGVAGETEENRAKRDLYNKSILDFVSEDASRLKSKLGYTDRLKLDEYLAGVRELEKRIQQAEQFAATQPDFLQPTGIPKQYEQHLRLMYDMMALAFQSDTTRIATFITAHDGDDRPYPLIGVPEGHHTLSHHENDQAKKEKIAKINRFHIEQFAYFLSRLKSVNEGDGTLLDNSMIVYGGAISDGNRHNHDNLPILLAGRGGDTLAVGRHVKLNKTPMTNLYLSMLDRMGVKTERVGDSTGKLENV